MRLSCCGRMRIRAREYDTIVLDPPAFAKSKRAAEGALRGYKEMNLRAMKMLRAGGTLVTCSCSHHVSLAEFTEVVAAAASDAGRRVQVLEVRGAAPDHPAVLTLPETSYLKCLILRVGWHRRGNRITWGCWVPPPTLFCAKYSKYWR